MHKATVIASDYSGNLLRRDWCILVAPPTQRGVVTLRDDGVALIDGKPFFPIGIFAVWKRAHNNHSFEQAMAELATAGFNTAHTYHTQRGPELDEFYRTAHRHGLKVIIAARTGANSTDVDTICYDIASEHSQPALFAWYLADDTASHISMRDLRRIHQAVHDIDPAHITCQADFMGTYTYGRPVRYTAYVEATDAFMPELYPIRSNDRAEVAIVTRDMKQIRSDHKLAGKTRAAWGLVQDFHGWGWQRFPTDAEERCMTYLSIIHGATGILWYTYGGWGDNHGATDDARVWAVLKSIAGELSALHEVLVERTPEQTAKATILEGAATDGLGYPSINLLLKVHDGDHYLLAANSAKALVKARITAPDLRGEVEVMFEGRNAAVRDGLFEDTFDPYAVHVYRW